MKKLTAFICLSVIGLMCYASAVKPSTTALNANETMILVGKTQISLAQYIRLSAKQYATLSGTSLKLKEKVSFKIVQHEMKKSIRKDGTVNQEQLKKTMESGFQWHWGGFVLGFFLSFIGVIIALFFKDENKMNRIYTALIGMGIGFIVGFALF